MIKRRPAETRGFLNWPWIQSRRTFSNNSYWDPQYMNYGSLKVINDDVLQPDKMVPNHEHKYFDILGYLVEGELEHTDSLGNVTRAKPGQVQHMRCGSSIWHTEKCVSDTPARYLQIWFTPAKQEEKTYYEIVNKDLEFGPLTVDILTSATLYSGVLDGDHTLKTTKKSYLYVVAGTVDDLKEGDGLEISQDFFTAHFTQAHVILFNDC